MFGVFSRTVRRFLLLACAGGFALPGQVGSAADARGGPGKIAYERIGTYDLARLNAILTTEFADFTTFAVSYPRAKSAVELYRVLYPTVVPEDNNRPVQASGLIAIPVHRPAAAPLLSYQHGTVFSRDEVPSFPDKSMETRLVIAAFASQGYVVIAADYLGKGSSTRPDSYLVKDSSAQACLDMVLAARSILAEKNVATEGLFLHGWSQGSFNTMVLLNRLEIIGEPVTAAAVASSPNDLYLCVNRWIHCPSALDVQWLGGAAALLIHSYERYYHLPGLSAVAIRPAYRQTARDLYENRITWEQAAKVFPATTRELLTDEFVEEGSLVGNRFFQTLQANRNYTWRFKTPSRFYYGEIDEVVTPYMVTLPVEYQRTLGGAPAEAIFAGKKANHRGTFAYAVRDLQKWFATYSGIGPTEESVP